jgi:RimJ/RimL family protein N-acetyltransferase
MGSTPGSDTFSRNHRASTLTVILRRATLADSRDLWSWRNDEITRRNSRTTDVISWDHHEAWYTALLANPVSEILIALEQQMSVGMIRFDQGKPGTFAVNFMVAPGSRGRGLGHSIVGMGCEYLKATYQNADTCAIVRVENLASRRIFESHGFRCEACEDEPGFCIYRRLLHE